MDVVLLFAMVIGLLLIGVPIAISRGLRSIIELALLDVMFELPSRTDVTKCVLTKETISRGQKPTLVTSGAASVVASIVTTCPGCTSSE